MNTIIKALIVMVSLHSSVTYAWNLFGPKNYDDCILQGMKGVTSDTAARHIARSCRDKFPAAKQDLICKEVEFNASEIDAVITDLKISAGGNVIRVNVYNGNRNKTVQEIEIELSNNKDSETQTYKLISPSYSLTGLQPLSTNEFITQIQRPKYKEVRYKVKAIRGCQL